MRTYDNDRVGVAVCGVSDHVGGIRGEENGVARKVQSHSNSGL